MSFSCYIKKCLKRSFLFQFPILFGAMKLPLGWRMHSQFGQKLKSLIRSLNLSMNLYKKLPKNKEWIYKSYLIIMIVLGGFGILGVKFLQFLCGISMILTAFIFNNPLPTYKQLKNDKVAFNYDNFFYFVPDLEFMLFITVGFAMIATAFKPCKKKEKIEEEIKVEEVIKEESEDNKKSGKSNKENKKGGSKKRKQE